MTASFCRTTLLLLLQSYFVINSKPIVLKAYGISSHNECAGFYVYLTGLVSRKASRPSPHHARCFGQLDHRDSMDLRRLLLKCRFTGREHIETKDLTRCRSMRSKQSSG